MKVRLLSVIASLALVSVITTPARAAGDSRVTRDDTPGSYLRYDGQSDNTMAACSTGRRMQNEPTVAVDPRDTNVIAAGSNDYCSTLTNPDVWAGYYRSTDGGATWQDSLLPGYPADTSAEGVASPVHGSCAAAGDPTQSFDTDGRLFYGFICFNRAKPLNGAVYAATYTDDGAAYARTVLIDAGTPSAKFTSGLFQDKISLAVDQTGGPQSGYVYVAWARYSGFANANNFILFSRSTDHGQSFSKPIKVSPGLGEESFADLAVGPDGAVYLTYRNFTHQGPTDNEIWLTKSTDGGLHWTRPVLVALFAPFDSNQFSGSGAGSCGDSIFFACPSGLTYSRFASLSAVAADDSGVHVVWNGDLPDGQSKVFVRNSPDGVSWPTPSATIDSAATGHQWFPDIASADGTITALFYDSRSDPAYSPERPPGNDASGVNSGDVVQTLAAQSTDGGVTWTETTITSAGSNFGWETHSSRRLGFWGDYNYVSAVPGSVVGAWTDSRDLVPGDDPRETGEDDDHDGFDVFQPCVYVPNDINAPSYSSPTVNDPCLSMGGLDQNIYAEQI